MLRQTRRVINTSCFVLGVSRLMECRRAISDINLKTYSFANGRRTCDVRLTADIRRLYPYDSLVKVTNTHGLHIKDSSDRGKSTMTCDLDIELYCRVRGTSYKHEYTGATKRYMIRKRLSKSDGAAESYLYQQA
ncbi:uncharacterized protein LOC111248988 [Varroa destructor]|uniref:Uncharacterized protein n=1 Tax=Varroa destructor TaxID=109461 RepID=A0A7M7JW54_VARDE|nr:uncharacterized protein LOC111248988 [Varroa destructor]